MRYGQAASCFLLLLIFICGLTLACDGGSDDDDSYAPPTGDDDDAGDDDDDDSAQTEIPEEPAYITERSFLLERSAWFDHIEPEEEVTIRSLGGQGVGNGEVFAAIGTATPLTRFHNAIGPDYERGDRFFSDKSMKITVGQEIENFDEQWLWRVRGTAIAIARLQNERLQFTTIDFAPAGTDELWPFAKRAIVRVAIVRNISDTWTGPVGIGIRTLVGSNKNGTLVENNGSGKILSVSPVIAKGKMAKGTHDTWLHLGDLASGAEMVIPYVFAFTYEDENPEHVFNAVQQAGIDRLLNVTYNWWQAWTGQSAQIQTPDQRIDDLFDSIRITTKSQQASNGATCPMYRYTRMWIRDTIGPAKFFGNLGLESDVRSMLDYFWHSVNERGGLSNSIDADNFFDTPPPVVDWENLGPGSGRTAAETPSYIPLQYWNYYRHTGDLALIAERYPMLRYCMLKLQFTEGMLLPFSGDETYRDVMKASLGLPLTTDFHADYLSTNSSILYLGAARAMERMATDLGLADDAEEYQGLYNAVKADMDAMYWNEDNGFYSPFADKATLTPWPAPYEDVGTKLLWTEAVARDDEKAESEILSLLDRIGRPDGLAVTPLNFPWYLIFSWAREGLFTGMSQGYVLHALTELDHPLAEPAFFTVAEIFVDAGSVAEVHILDNFDQLQLLNEPIGPIGDFVARNRPWEGSILGAALLHYLTGLKADVASGRVDLTPHLPQGWNGFSIDRLPFHESRFDLDLAYEPGVRTTTVTAGGEGFTLGLVVSVPSEIVLGLNVDGVPLDLESLPAQSRWGITRITLPDMDLEPGQAAVVTLFYAE